MSTQRPSRPTTREVTFPDEDIEINDDDKGDEGEDLELKGVEYYAPRENELPESTPDINSLLGESEAVLSPTAPDAEEEKPVRLLRDWAVFDARPSKAKDAGGALAFAMVSLHVLDGLDAALDSIDAGCAPEGAGDASPYCGNARQEDNGDDSTGGEEEGDAESTQRLRLGAIMRYTINYTKHKDPIYLETTMAWYILGIPAPEYHALFALFIRAHRIAQVLVCMLMRDPHTTIDTDTFIAELQRKHRTLMDVSSPNSRSPDMSDVHDAVPTILAALDTLDDTKARTLRNTLLLRQLLASRPSINHDIGGRSIKSLPLLPQRRLARTHVRRERYPPTDKSRDLRREREEEAVNDETASKRYKLTPNSVMSSPTPATPVPTPEVVTTPKTKITKAQKVAEAIVSHAAFYPQHSLQSAPAPESEQEHPLAVAAVGIQYLQLVYVVVETTLQCRMCLLRKREVDEGTEVATYPIDAAYRTLVGHCEIEHEEALDALAKMTPSEIAEMHQSLQPTQRYYY